VHESWWTTRGCRIASDRRQWQRLPLAIPLFLRGCDRSGKEFLDFTTALNVSAGGALVAARRPLRPSTRLSLEIPSSPLPRLPASPNAVSSLKAKIVWSATKDTYNLYALRFNRPLL
jgi:hypothetical protein